MVSLFCSSLDFAAHIARLECIFAIMTRVGEDARSDAAINEIKKLGIDSSFVQMDPMHLTGTASFQGRAYQPARCMKALHTLI